MSMEIGDNKGRNAKKSGRLSGGDGRGVNKTKKREKTGEKKLFFLKEYGRIVWR